MALIVTWFISRWFVVSQLHDRRSRENHRRQLQTEYLTETFRRLEVASFRDVEKETEKVTILDGALSNVQLLGRREQIRLAENLTDTLPRANGKGDPSHFLDGIRKDFRKKLNLNPAPSEVFVWRWLTPREALVQE